MLSIKNLTKTFENKEIFNNFSCDFPERGAVIITGDSGIGKTTLLRIISGLDRDYSGEVEKNAEAEISYQFQEHRLFPTLTALANAMIAIKDKNEEKTAEAKSLLSTLKFTEKDFSLYPPQLSGGMKQRISFARAILCDSNILLLDEPTKELDEELSAIVINIIKEEAKKRLVIIVTHESEKMSLLDATLHIKMN